ncbi:MAG: hypothetical protein DMD66_06350 [Gemmatimonadetes bacterium]|nr:MAG: hypothetical protein DMD66_06350 [Gemmatimonadota bacterium]
MAGVGDVRRVEDADAAQPLMTDGIGHALLAAVGAPVQRLTGHEQQVAEDGDVALRAGADEGPLQGRMLGVRDIPHLDPGEIPLNDVVAPD